MDSKLRPSLSARQRKRQQRHPPKRPPAENSTGEDRFPLVVCEIGLCVWDSASRPIRAPSQTGLLPSSRLRKHESPHLAIIEALYSEVWLGLIRKTHFHGKGRGLRGKTQSSHAGCDVAQTAAADRSQRARRIRHE